MLRFAFPGFVNFINFCKESKLLVFAFGAYYCMKKISFDDKLGMIREYWRPRLARESDIPALEALIPVSVRALQAPHYSPTQMEAALGPVFAVDRQLIRDGTYFVVERDGVIVGCGGWSRRRSLYGGDAGREQEDEQLDPHRDAARVRAFFVHPEWARRGIGRSIMIACELAIFEAGFSRVDIVATLAGEPLYASFGYAIVERFEIMMAGGLSLPAVRMNKSLDRTA
jgi:GNAT superfamily N-acetyltransferase